MPTRATASPESDPARHDGQWADRVVERGAVDPRTLRPNPRNWRLHPDEQRRPLEAALSTIGWVREAALINRRSPADGWAAHEIGDYLVDGHLRVDAAIAAGQATVPYLVVALSPVEEARVLATLDPIAALALGDAAAYAELVSLIGADAPDALLALCAATQDDLNALRAPDEAPGGVHAPGGADSDDPDGSGAAIRLRVTLEGSERALQAAMRELGRRGIRWWTDSGAPAAESEVPAAT